ncbi:MAG TPA: SRPBCC domain-containing protein, partial [Bacteroidia bacterium]|nr:SRPBCC domain-containing protein [Bacteroidia bacterium]
MEKKIVVTRIFNAPVELVWQNWTDPELIKQWWGPDKFTCPTAKIDFREGGTSIVSMLAPVSFGGQETFSIWVYTKIKL